MPNQHKHPGITWHSADPTRKPRLEAEVAQRGSTLRELLDEITADWFARLDEADVRQVEAHTTNERIRVELREARRDPAATETGEQR